MDKEQYTKEMLALRKEEQRISIAINKLRGEYIKSSDAYRMFPPGTMVRYKNKSLFLKPTATKQFAFVIGHELDERDEVYLSLVKAKNDGTPSQLKIWQRVYAADAEVVDDSVRQLLEDVHKGRTEEEL